MGLYEREVRFYTDVAPGSRRADSRRAIHAAYDPRHGVFDLLLGDAAPGRRRRRDQRRHSRTGDAGADPNSVGCTAPLLGDAALAGAEWLNRESPLSQALIGRALCRVRRALRRRHRTRAPRGVRTTGRGVRRAISTPTPSGRPQGLVHGDYRLDNLLFGEDGADRPLTVVDWQTVTWGPAITDVAYFLGCALPVDQRREHVRRLLRAYHDALGRRRARQPRRRPRRRAPRELLRGDDVDRLADAGGTHRARRRMFMTMIARHCSHVLDTDALAILPPPVDAGTVAAQRRRRGYPPADRRDRCGTRAGTSTSPTPSQDVGGWLRLGLIPNQGHAWINALRVRSQHADHRRPGLRGRRCPTTHTRVHTDDVDLRPRRHRAAAVVPGVAARPRDRPTTIPPALLRGEPGRPVDLEMDLVWTTAGVPYQYRLSTALRDPLHGVGHRHRRRSARSRSTRVRRPAGPLLGGAGLVGHGLGMERTASRRRHPPPRRGPADPRRAADGGAGTSSARATWWSCRPSSRGRRSATTGCRSAPRSNSNRRTMARRSTYAGTRRCC